MAFADGGGQGWIVRETKVVANQTRMGDFELTPVIVSYFPTVATKAAVFLAPSRL